MKKGLMAIVAVILVACLGGCPAETPPPTGLPYSLSGTVFQNGVEVQTLNNVGQSANIAMSGPGVVVLDFMAKTPTTRPIYWVDTTLEIYYKDEFGSDILWVSLTEDGPVIMSAEKSAEELALLALVFLAGVVHVNAGVADCVGGAYPGVYVDRGKSFQVEVPFSPAAKSVVARVTLKDGLGTGAKKFTHTVNLIGPVPVEPEPTPFSVKIIKPSDGAVLTEGKTQLFAAEAAGTSEVSWFWLFADNTISAGSQVVAKIVSPELAGEVSVLGTTPEGRISWDTIMVSTAPEGDEPETRGVEITSPVAGSTITDKVFFNAELLGNEVPKSVEWFASEGYHDTNRLSFSIPVSTFGLGVGTWNIWAKVVVEYEDGETFSDEILFQVKVNPPDPEAVTAKITQPADKATLPLDTFVSFKGEASGGVAPLTTWWFFPDGTKLFGEVVEKKFAFPGEGYVYFTVEDFTGASKTDQIYIYIDP